MEHLDTIVKITTLIAGFGGIAKWIVHRIERGQREVISQHRRDLKLIRKELRKRISRKECKQLRAECPCRKEA